MVAFKPNIEFEVSKIFRFRNTLKCVGQNFSITNNHVASASSSSNILNVFWYYIGGRIVYVDQKKLFGGK